MPSCPGASFRSGRWARRSAASSRPARRGPRAARARHGPVGERAPGRHRVGRAGSILVVGSRIDAEALTRARAMGVRGVIVSGLRGKEPARLRRRPRRASEPPSTACRRSRSSCSRGPCAVRWPSPVRDCSRLDRPRGRHRRRTSPTLVLDAPDVPFAPPPPGDASRPRRRACRARGHRGAGCSACGGSRRRPPRRPAAVRLADGAIDVAVALGDLERFG